MKVGTANVTRDEMVVFICDAFDEGLPSGFDKYTSLLFLNQAAQAVCEKAGVQLDLVNETDELPEVSLLVDAPLFHASA